MSPVRWSRLMLGLVLYCGVFAVTCAVGGMAYFHFANPQNTCASCHEMTGVHSDWAVSAHRTVQCRECHGGALTLDVHALQSHLDRIVRHFTGDPNQPVRLLEKHVTGLVDSCRRCHPQAYSDWQASRHSTTYARIFLDPEHNVTGTGWNALQSKTAIGNGGLSGCGFMQGTQNQFGFLPDQFSDFPFAVYAEDWGLLGSALLMALYCFLCVWAIHIASQAKDRFGAALAIGVGALIFWQVVANVGMASGILPVVGITLPLFSYGGSSVLTFMVGLGLLMNVSMRR